MSLLSVLALSLSMSAEAAEASSKIINGQDAGIEDYSAAGGMIFDAALIFNGNAAGDLRMFMCSSTLIAPDVVLLAAHCVDEEMLSLSLTYGYGSLENVQMHWTRQTDLTMYSYEKVVDYPEDVVEAWDWTFHPDWDFQTLGVGLRDNHDIALLFLDEPVLDVPFVYLATSEEAQQLSEGMPLTVVGWGQQSATGQNEQPPAGSYGVKQMGESHIAELSDFEFKVGEAESDVRKCHGDSGGPSFAHIETELSDDLRLVGVTSHAYDNSDCFETGGVDTRVDYHLAWIDAEMRARCEDGTRAWCEEPGIPDPSIMDDGEEEEEVVAELEEKGRLATLFGCSSLPAQRNLGWMGALAGLVMLGYRRRD